MLETLCDGAERLAGKEFAARRQANISKADLALLRDAAAEAPEWTGEELDGLVASGTLVEIEDGARLSRRAKTGR